MSAFTPNEGRLKIYRPESAEVPNILYVANDDWFWNPTKTFRYGWAVDSDYSDAIESTKFISSTTAEANTRDAVREVLESLSSQLLDERREMRSYRVSKQRLIRQLQISHIRFKWV